MPQNFTAAKSSGRPVSLRIITTLSVHSETGGDIVHPYCDVIAELSSGAGQTSLLQGLMLCSVAELLAEVFTEAGRSVRRETKRVVAETMNEER